MERSNSCKERYHLLDTIRGITLINMMLFHASWDMVFMFAHNWAWFSGRCAYYWQQSICWTFILLSGFCYRIGKHHFKRGMIVSIAGAVISLVTFFFMPKGSNIIFGVLTFIGFSMIVLAPLEKYMRRLNPFAGIAIFAVLFFITKDINIGYLGFEELLICPLPKQFYKGMIMTFIGFMEPGFLSGDYFSVIPWIFLFLTGYYSNSICKMSSKLFRINIKPFSFLGRHSLIVYLVHQPLIFGLLYVIHMAL